MENLIYRATLKKNTEILSTDSRPYVHFYACMYVQCMYVCTVCIPISMGVDKHAFVCVYVCMIVIKNV